MGQFNQIAIIESIKDQMEYIPTVALLNGQPGQIVPRSQLGPVVIAKAGYTPRTNRQQVTIVLTNGRSYKCNADVFPGGEGFPLQFIDALTSCQASAEKVMLYVVKDPDPTRFAARDYFCGVSLASRTEELESF
jgi:hypothetical protein